MNERKTQVRSKPIWREGPFIVGLMLTLLVCAAFGFSLFGLPAVSASASFDNKWQHLVTATANEVGDTLAGFAGSLAFVWLVVTVWLQATELREQRKEFERMADAQNAQVDLLIKQGEIFELEQKEREENRAHRLLIELMVSLRLSILDSRVHEDWSHSISMGNIEREFTLFPLPTEQNAASDNFHFVKQSHDTLKRFMKYLSDGKIKGKCSHKEKYIAVSKVLHEIYLLNSKLSPAAQQNLVNYELFDFQKEMDRFLESDLWEVN